MKSMDTKMSAVSRNVAHWLQRARRSDNRRLPVVSLLLWGFLVTGSVGAGDGESQVINFSDLTLAEESRWNGEDESGGFRSGGFHFPNEYTDWGDGFYSWGGFAYANRTDRETPGITNQYSSFTGGGIAGPGSVFAVGYTGGEGARLHGPAHHTFQPQRIWVSNNTYTALSMRDGDDFAKKFGGETGDDPDYLYLLITGVGADGDPVGLTTVFLADYRGELTDIADDWLEVDLSGFAEPVVSLHFQLMSSDEGDWGMNTPAYFVLGQLESFVSVQPFPEAEAGPWGGRFAEGFGTFHDAYLPWLWHRFWGWIYWPEAQSAGGAVTWSPEHGWFYHDTTNPGILFHYESQGWWFYMEDSDGGRYYDFSTGQWLLTPPSAG